MNAKVLLILLLVIALVAGIGAAIFLLTRQPSSTSGPSITTPTSTVSPSTAPTAEGKAELSVDSDSASFTIGETSTIDIYLDTKGETVDGFQFIANITGSALPAVVDTDTATQGIQIEPAPIPNMTIATNSVTSEGDRSVVRFAMLLDDTASTGFSSSTPTKIASLQVTPGSGGTIAINFSEQNSRVRSGSTGSDVLAKVTPSTFTVASTGGLAQVPATISSQSAAEATTQPTSSPTSIAPFCLQSCVSDNDCAAGLVCQADRCVNPACATSQTCSCAQSTTTTPRPSAIASASPSATPVATLIAQATPTIEPSTPEASDSALPTAGSFETTLLVVGAGLLLFGTGVVLAGNRAYIDR